MPSSPTSKRSSTSGEVHGERLEAVEHDRVAVPRSVIAPRRFDRREAIEQPVEHDLPFGVCGGAPRQ